jgi:hypothetical protein
MNSDFKDLLRIFNEYGVEYLVIGGYAVMEYTEPRYTKNLDLWIRADPKNAKAVYQALSDFGAPLKKLNPDDFAEEGYFYQMGIAPSRIDILMSLPGLRFSDAWPHRVVVEMGKIKTYFVSKADLITIKRAAGRPEDLLDLQRLLLAQKSNKTKLSLKKPKLPRHKK